MRELSDRDRNKNRKERVCNLNFQLKEDREGARSSLLSLQAYCKESERCSLSALLGGGLLGGLLGGLAGGLLGGGLLGGGLLGGLGDLLGGSLGGGFLGGGGSGAGHD